MITSRKVYWKAWIVLGLVVAIGLLFLSAIFPVKAGAAESMVYYPPLLYTPGEQPVERWQFDSVIVPIDHENESFYANRNNQIWHVCTSSLLDAATQAAAEWNAVLPAGRMQVNVVSGCTDGAHESQIDYANLSKRFPRWQGAAIGATGSNFDNGTVEYSLMYIDFSVTQFPLILNVITHEMGHALGLNHPLGAQCTDSVMAPYACDGRVTPPTQADIDAVSEIYGSRVSTGTKLYDTDHNGQLDDHEFFSAVDLYIHNQLDDATFFQLIDLWISGNTLAASFPHTLGQANRISVYDLTGHLIAKDIGQFQLRQLIHTLPLGAYIYTGERSARDRVIHWMGRFAVTGKGF